MYIGICASLKIELKRSTSTPDSPIISVIIVISNLTVVYVCYTHIYTQTIRLPGGLKKNTRAQNSQSASLFIFFFANYDIAIRQKHNF